MLKQSIKTGMAALQADTTAADVSRIRNICILAHVDHGKTTLSDCLIASNGIISQRLAGELRYLDSRPDEQQRGITMESSAISLIFRDPREQRRLDKEYGKAAKTDDVEEGNKTDGRASAGALPKKRPLAQPYSINLIDSPGHVDFSSDVSTAVRLCDGALVVVDAVEGVCIQTQAVIRQAWEERVKPCLVINKVDRLITEIKLSPLEAFHHIRQIIERVNALISQLANADILASASSGSSTASTTPSSFGCEDASGGREDRTCDDDDFAFDPTKGNVVFASAIHGWGFTLGPWATMLSKRLQIKRGVLLKHLWGEYYFNSKAKSVSKKPKNSNHMPMIAKMVLEPVWKLYKTGLEEGKPKKVVKMAKGLGLSKFDTIPDRLLHPPYDKLIREVMKTWWPLSAAVLQCAVQHVPNPGDAQMIRADRLFPDPSTRIVDKSSGYASDVLKGMSAMYSAVRECSRDAGAPVIAFVSKMLAVNLKDLPLSVQATISANSGPRNESRATSDADDSMEFVACARIFSGTLHRGQPIFVLGPKYNPISKSMKSVMHALIQKESSSGQAFDHTKSFDLDIFKHLVREVHHSSLVETGIIHPMRMMGNGFVPLEEAGPGNIVAIAGLGSHVLKSATLCSSPMCAPFSEMAIQSTPILSVAIESKTAADMQHLRHGLNLLNHADPCVEVSLSGQGELVMKVLGELHLERCLEDLRERFAKGLEFEVSPPLVSFKETLVPVSLESKNRNGAAESSETSGAITVKTPNGMVELVVEATNLPEPVVRVLEQYEEVLQSLSSDSTVLLASTSANNSKLNKLINGLRLGMDAEDFDRICAIGPHHTGPNILICDIPGEDWRLPWLDSRAKPVESDKKGGTHVPAGDARLVAQRTSIINGFQLATEHGPLCEEPLWGVCYRLKALSWCEPVSSDEIVSASTTSTEEKEKEKVREKEATCRSEEKVQKELDSTPSAATGERDPYGPLSGQIISSMRRACRVAFSAKKGSNRLVEAVFRCDLQCTSEQLGKLYSVLGQRRCEILDEELWEGTSIFSIKARIPVAETVGLASHLRKETSGSISSPQLRFDRWQILDDDPFFQPTTAEEREEYGEVNHEDQIKSIAKVYIDKTRARKGLDLKRKIVVSGEKQRTLSKKK